MPDAGTGYSDIISFIVVGFQSHWDEMSPEEMNLSSVYSYCSPYAGFTQMDIAADSFIRGYRIRKDKLVEIGQGLDDSLMELQLEKFSDCQSS